MLLHHLRIVEVKSALLDESKRGDGSDELCAACECKY
jgi:hypothetical protein